ncbi:MAG: PAS domain S-box protein, partial [Candidatus Acidiferrales bacterium]
VMERMAPLNHPDAVNSSASEVEGAVRAETVRKKMHQAERRQWWLWFSVIAITLLLTLGMLSFTFPFLFGSRPDAIYELNLRNSIRGLVLLVLIFDCYAFYQQWQLNRIRRQMHQSQELFHLITQNADDLIAVVDVQGRRLYNSPSYEKRLGYTPSELQNTPALDQIHPDDIAQVQAAAQEALQSGVGRRVEYRFKHKDGTWRNLESTASVVQNEKGTAELLVIVNRDVTDRKKAEESIRQRDDRLRQVQKMEAVGRLSGGVAHDFNNLLSVIIGYAEILEEQLKEDNRMIKNVAEIKKAGQRAAGLTRQLLAFSRQQVLQPKILDANVVVGDMGRMLRRLIGEDIELSITLEPALGKIKVDQSQLEQIIMNLAVNARDAMPWGGKLTIETSNDELEEAFCTSMGYNVLPGRYVKLTVSDTGTGMTAETQAHIFEPFFTTKEKGKGTGLGLATVYGVVKQSGGYVWVASILGEGTTFKILLPEVVEPLSVSAVASPEKSAATTSETVLLVEDEDAIRNLIANQLTSGGFRVLTAANGLHALRVAGAFQEKIHLMITDVVMPGMNGADLAKELSKSRPEMRILFMTGYIEFRPKDQANLPSEAQILSKPFSNKALLAKVSEILAQDEVISST